MNTEVRAYFHHGRFGSPCTQEQIAAAEGRIGMRLPDPLRELYLEFDGFRGPTNAQYLFPLAQCTDGGSSLCDMTLLFRDWKLIDLSSFIFFGSSSADECWGMSASDPKKIIAYHHHMEDEFEYAGSDILQVYLADEKKA
jgi:cell wall assembly regulator SMI1